MDRWEEERNREVRTGHLDRFRVCDCLGHLVVIVLSLTAHSYPVRLESVRCLLLIVFDCNQNVNRLGP